MNLSRLANAMLSSPMQAQPRPRDPLMPVPYMGPQTFDLGQVLKQPLYQQSAPQQDGFLSPGLQEFLQNYYSGQRQL